MTSKFETIAPYGYNANITSEEREEKKNKRWI